jgi:YceI-like protein
VSRFRILPGRSSVETEVRSSLHPIHAQSHDVRGLIEGEFDEAGRPLLDRPHRAWVEIPVETIRSGSRINDLEMQRRADVRRYPVIRFEVDRAWSVDGTDRLRAALAVTARGRTRSIEEDFSVHVDGRELVVAGEHRFDMRDFGMNPPRILTLKVDPQVRVRLRLVAEEEDAG